MKPKVKLTYLVSHPIQYQAPLLRKLANDPEIQFRALFMSDFSIREYKDEGFGTSLTWDVPLVEGYQHQFLGGRGCHDPVTGLLPTGAGLSAALSSKNLDVLWMHGYHHPINIRAIRIARAQGVPVMVRSENQHDSSPDAGFKRKIKEAAIRSIFPKVDAFLAIGTRNHEYYRSYGVPEAKIFSVPYAVDNEFFQAKCQEAAQGREALRGQLGLEEGRPIILFASKFLHRKRPLDLLEAYAKLSPDGVKEPNAYLLFIGDGELSEPLKHRAAQLGWNSIHFLGFRNQTELPKFLELCDVFVLASEKEPWGLVVNEAMNAGKPVIATPGVGSAPDLVHDGVTGRVVPVGDVDALSQAIVWTLEDPSRASKLGAAALARINDWSYQQDIEGIKRALGFVQGHSG